MRGPWPLPCLTQEKLAACTNNSSQYSCSDLVPLGMKWACTCAGRGNVSPHQKTTHSTSRMNVTCDSFIASDLLIAVHCGVKTLALGANHAHLSDDVCFWTSMHCVVLLLCPPQPFPATSPDVQCLGWMEVPRHHAHRIEDERAPYPHARSNVLPCEIDPQTSITLRSTYELEGVRPKEAHQRRNRDRFPV